jgi:DNA-directed RNA polymerase subunit RPC12/RpoP
MSNIQKCPECDAEIDTTQASLDGACPNCGTPFKELVYR